MMVAKHGQLWKLCVCFLNSSPYTCSLADCFCSSPSSQMIMPQLVRLFSWLSALIFQPNNHLLTLYKYYIYKFVVLRLREKSIGIHTYIYVSANYNFIIKSSIIFFTSKDGSSQHETMTCSLLNSERPTSSPMQICHRHRDIN